MFESCLTLLSTGVESRPSVDSFRAFLRDRGVAWPDEPRDTTHPLDVLVDLSVNWLVDLFFALVVRRNGRTRLELKEAPVVWASFRGATHADQLQTVAELRHYASKMGSGLQLNKTRAQHLATVEARVLHFLETNLSVSNHARSLDVVDVARLAEWTPAVPSSLWIAILKKHLKGAVVIRGSTEVLVDSVEHVVSFGNLLKQFSAKELLDLIGWWLARLFSDLAGIQRDSSKHSEARDASRVCENGTALLQLGLDE
ncbi:hypothetical protein HPB48_006263 [Haemaphysalis longicornis]|uniref:Uncharacterized protein n=1 Tax=Haemaphysalis longicornis TaxID=44386 RepID=A0A9J6GT76_HAELO|nr:hypothetical protein HPB48_006263 [Haemaphysalis longicornis]